MTSLAGCNWTATSSQSWVVITAGSSGNGNGSIAYTVASNPTTQVRSATITAGGQVLNITQDGLPCTYSLSPGSANFDSDGGAGSVGMASPTGCAWTASSSDGWITITSGGSGSVGMTSPTGCAWSASSSDGWITIISGSSGSGNGTISYSVAANPTIQSRSGTITAAGQTLTITQTGIDCTYSFSSSSASWDSDGGGGVVGMTSPTGCSWTASSSDGWITITAGASGSGNGSISYTVASNATIQTRTGTITAAGQTLAITQSGIDCTFDLSSSTASFDSDGASGSVSVISPPGCAWTANSSGTWISISAGGLGSGNGSISYTVASNPTLQSRSGTITIEDQVLTLTQEGISCTYSLSPSSASFESDGGSSTASITAPDVCSWSASSSEGWITVTAGLSGNGNGSLSFTVAPNTTIESRSGTMAVEDQVLTVTQSRIDCSYSLSSTSASFDSDSGKRYRWHDVSRGL